MKNIFFVLVSVLLIDSCGCGFCYFERTDWPYYLIIKTDSTYKYIYLLIDSNHSQYESLTTDYQDTINYYKNKSNFSGFGSNIILEEKCSDFYKFNKVKNFIKVSDNCK